MKQQRQISVKNYKSRKGFLHRYQKLIKDTVVPYQYAVLHDEVEGVAKSHVAANFENAAKALQGKAAGDGFYGEVFQDSDAAKWLEAAAFCLAAFSDEELERQMDGLIEKVAAAQDEDGYLNTYYTIKDREKRWTNLQEGHELYCAGHMMEAATAYYEATGKERLLKVMQKNMEHIYRRFVGQGQEGYPGHPEVELALLKMYCATGEKRCLELAAHFINTRGVDPDYYIKEAKRRGWNVWGNDPEDRAYTQSDKPVRELSDATGHSVRAVYLYTAMAELAALTEDEELRKACERLWSSIADRRMYVTGGIGSTVLGEAFTVDYNLPNDTAYAETCASIGLMFFALRMLEMEVDSRYSDVMERAFYNTVLAGMQLDGRRFFYVNPLEVIPGISGTAVTHRHDLPQRPGWYACACCPPNAARLIASIGQYAYGENDTTVFCHLFAEGLVSFQNGLVLECETEYPYGFTVTYRVKEGSKVLAVRQPDWSEKFAISVNGMRREGTYEKGYWYLPDIKEGDTVRIVLDDEVKKVYASPKVASDSAMAAFQRGPLVYCAEGADNEEDVLSLAVKEGGWIRVCPYDEKELEGTVKLLAEGYRIKDTGGLYRYTKPGREACTITLVPYYTWGNRGINQMRVWLPQQ